MNVCPQECIILVPDENGFLFPEVDMNNCIDCDLCISVCAFQNDVYCGSEVINTYAAVHKNNSVLLKSSSGGVFSALAEIIYKKEGIVCGCIWDENYEAKHICIGSTEDLHKMHGSKYVQSDVGKSFKKVKGYLKNGRDVLFSGTPCQIAGLKSFLGKEYENLITVDLVCHGVPNLIFYKGYLDWLENRFKGKVTAYTFRNKEKSGKTGKVTYQHDGKSKEKIIEWPTDPYYSHYMYGHINRESCYKCKYASPKRQGDFTMGDYWGIQNAHPEIDADKGVSVLLVNSEKGVKLVEKLKEHLYLTPSTFEQAALENGQLIQPVSKSDIRETIFAIWREGGFQAVADAFYKENRKEIISFHIKRVIPRPAKSAIRKLFGKGR